jgi:hypothetical protein
VNNFQILIILYNLAPCQVFFKENEGHLVFLYRAWELPPTVFSASLEAEPNSQNITHPFEPDMPLPIDKAA